MINAINTRSAKTDCFVLLTMYRMATKKMKKVQLDGNGLTTSSFSRGFYPSIFLQILDLSNNALRDAPWEQLEKLPLIELNLSNNCLEEIRRPITKLINLKILDISGNRLSFPPIPLIDLPSLQKLKWNPNPWKTLPVSLVRTNNMQNLMSYLRALFQEKVQWNRVKLMIVGQENVGKSSLLRCLQSVPRDINISTNGIDMQTLNNLSETIEFSAWDFGGQEIFHPTHQVSFSPFPSFPLSLFPSFLFMIVLLNARKEEKLTFSDLAFLIPRLSSRS